jgi:hypothetical protein
MDFERLNSATKYPSILTHHELGDRGMLQDTLGPFANVSPETIAYLREKVDGTNSRMVFFNNTDYVLGSREELLHARGDRLSNPALGIVETLQPIAENIVRQWSDRWSGEFGSSAVMVLYFETYGGKIGAQAKQYSGANNMGVRLFDYALVDTEVLTWSREKIARWRDEEQGQNFGDIEDLKSVARDYGLPVVPNLGSMPVGELPNDLVGMLRFMNAALPETQAYLDDDGKGLPEGIVLRTHDRSVISKARFQDYERTLKRRGGK